MENRIFRTLQTIAATLPLQNPFSVGAAAQGKPRVEERDAAPPQPFVKSPGPYAGIKNHARYLRRRND